MPTALPSLEKANFIALVDAAPFPGGPREAARLQTILNNYEDIFTAFCRQINLFVSNKSYLTEAMAVFTDAQLIAVGIWNNKASAPVTSVDPICIINSTISTNITLSPSTGKVLAIVGTSAITQITLAASTVVDQIYIGPGSELKYLIGTNSGALIKLISLPFLSNTVASLFAVAFGTHINSVDVEYGSFFGGFTNIDPAVLCNTPVSALAVGTVTHNTVPLTWTPPVSNFLFINVYSRKKGASDWTQATEASGYFDGTIGYTYNTLKEDTEYEFRVIVVCKNGGWSTPQLAVAQTTCCQ